MQRSRFSILAALAMAVSGCSGGLDLPLPSLPSLPSKAPEFPGTSTAVFTRVARGANTCWFGPRGTLDRTYIWHAKAEPEAMGGAAEILIHERVDKNQRGLKAFSVTIAPKGDGSAVDAKNVKMPEDAGKRMVADAYRWARGGVGCAEGDTTWTPVTATPAPRPEPKGKKPARKAANKDASRPEAAAAADPASKTQMPASPTAPPAYTNPAAAQTGPQKSP